MVEDFKNSAGNWVGSYTIGGQTFQTRAYMVWRRMLSRCKEGSKFQADKPTYVGCTVGGTFKQFQRFTDWYVKQIGYGVEGYALDKDILCKGNKEYNEDTCVLVPRALNSFTTYNKSTQGLYPVGVQFDISTGKFMASIYVGGKNKTLGRFYTVEAASQCYVKAKEAEARRWADRLKRGEFPVDARVITALENWRVYDTEA